MPRYRFIGVFETVLHGLSHGVNATLHRDLGEDDDGNPIYHGQPDESTVVASPGDEVETAESYPHALMVNVETGEPDSVEEPGGEPKTAAPRKAAAKKAAAKKSTAPTTSESE